MNLVKEQIKSQEQELRTADRNTASQLKSLNKEFKGIRTKILAYNADQAINLDIATYHINVLRLTKKDATAHQCVLAGATHGSQSVNETLLLKFITKNADILLSKDPAQIQAMKNEQEKALAERIKNFATSQENARKNREVKKQAFEKMMAEYKLLKEQAKEQE